MLIDKLNAEYDRELIALVKNLEGARDDGDQEDIDFCEAELSKFHRDKDKNYGITFQLIFGEDE